MCSAPTIVGFFRPWFPVKSVLMLSIFREILPWRCGKPEKFRPSAGQRLLRNAGAMSLIQTDPVGRKRADVVNPHSTLWLCQNSYSIENGHL